MIVTTKGIILKSIKYGETSLIQDIYTEAFGLKSYIVSGVRNKKKGNKSGLLQLMGLVEMVVYNKDTNSLNRIKEVKAAKLYTSIPFNVIKSTTGMFITEVARRAITENEQSDALFRLLYDSFSYLDDTDHSIAIFPILFMIKLSQELGFSPADNYAADRPIFNIMEGEFIPGHIDSQYNMDERVSQYFYSLLHEDYGIARSFQVPKPIRMYLLEQLIMFYQLHLNNFGEIKSLDVIKQVLN